jgi:hypothetical protein
MAVTRSSKVASGVTNQISSYPSGDEKKITRIEYNNVTGQIIVRYEE